MTFRNTIVFNIFFDSLPNNCRNILESYLFSEDHDDRQHLFVQFCFKLRILAHKVLESLDRKAVKANNRSCHSRVINIFAMRNAKLTESHKIVSFYGSLLEWIVRQLPLLINLSLHNNVDISHSFIATNDRLILLNKLLYLFAHQLFELLLLQSPKYGKFYKFFSVGDLVFDRIIVFYSSEVTLNFKPHLEIELFIDSSLFMVFFEQF